jgi:hypothetical protein
MADARRVDERDKVGGRSTSEAGIDAGRALNRAATPPPNALTNSCLCSSFVSPEPTLTPSEPLSFAGLDQTAAADNRRVSTGSAAHACPADPYTPLGTAPPVDLPASVAVHASHYREAPGTTTPASSLATASTTHTWPTGANSGRPPTPACVGHRPSTLDSQEER